MRSQENNYDRSKVLMVNILGTRVGPGGRDQTLGIKGRKNAWKSASIKKFR